VALSNRIADIEAAEVVSNLVPRYPFISRTKAKFARSRGLRYDWRHDSLGETEQEVRFSAGLGVHEVGAPEDELVAGPNILESFAIFDRGTSITCNSSTLRPADER
jgi:hypothetical protein